MKKETIIWQVVILALGLFMIFTIKIYLRNSLVVEYDNNRIDNIAKRANCFMLAEEKNISNAYCSTIDETDELLNFYYQNLYK